MIALAVLRSSRPRPPASACPHPTITSATKPCSQGSDQASKGVDAALEDRFGGPQSFDISQIVTSAIRSIATARIAHPDVHQEASHQATEGWAEVLKSDH